MAERTHIPQVHTIRDFFRLLRFGEPTGEEISVTRVEDQPKNKRTEVPPFRSNIYRIIFLVDSEVEWNLPNQRISATSQCIYFAYPGKLESWKANPNNKGYVVCFNEEFSKGYDKSQSIDQAFPFFNFEGRSLLYLTREEAEQLQPIVQRMLKEGESFAPDRKLMLKYLLFQYLIMIHRIYKQSEEELPPVIRNSTSIYNNFKRELDLYFADLAEGRETRQVSVGTIADRLALTPAYLGTVIKDLTGKTAVGHITEKTILEAKSYLLHTDLQMSEISHRLGFNNSSYFARFFRKNTGETPKSYQALQKAEVVI